MRVNKNLRNIFVRVACTSICLSAASAKSLDDYVLDHMQDKDLSWVQVHANMMDKKARLVGAFILPVRKSINSPDTAFVIYQLPQEPSKDGKFDVTTLMYVGGPEKPKLAGFFGNNNDFLDLPGLLLKIGQRVTNESNSYVSMITCSRENPQIPNPSAVLADSTIDPIIKFDEIQNNRNTLEITYETSKLLQRMFRQLDGLVDPSRSYVPQAGQIILTRSTGISRDENGQWRFHQVDTVQHPSQGEIDSLDKPADLFRSVCMSGGNVSYGSFNDFRKNFVSEFAIPTINPFRGNNDYGVRNVGF